MQHDRPNPSRFPVLRDLLDSADRLLSQGQMLPELEAKAFFDRACFDAAKLRGVPPPMCTLRVLRDGTAWFYTQSPTDDAGRSLPALAPDFLFWTDLMRQTGPWVSVLGVEEAHAIADLIAFDETLVGKFRLNGEPCDQRRTVCMKALYPVALDEEADPYAEAEQTEGAEEALQRFRHRLKSLTMRRTLAFERHDMSSPAMTEPKEIFDADVARLERNATGVGMVEGFFEAEGVGAR
jgi:hypothetical protein